ncbi:MAG: VOC family protein [Bacteroidota bacterium]|nr:VOC family protein [Christiangramia sp.]MEE2770891.1 VOC family protein [Bacteroidota bacterium]|tara:strand:+ start:190 stop:618 length:429 start_codon:yes stop_codon:yes gene_type:complete
MAKINPYLHYNGNAEEAFQFYKSVFGGEFVSLARFKDMPPNPEYPIPAEIGDKIMHIALPIGEHDILMASDVPPSLGTVNENENRSKISITAESKEEANRLFEGLSKGGAVEMPMEDSPWGSYFGMFRDRFGIEWMIDYSTK